MKLIDLTVPLGIGTPAWPTYEPLQDKYFIGIIDRNRS